LATQKPAGVVDDQIWSNSKFRVCLKVQEKADSMDMLKRPDAAEISQTGRFFLQVGFNELFAIGQSAWSGAEYIPTETIEKKVDSAIRIVDHLGRIVKEAKPIIKSDTKEKKPKQLVALVKYLSELAAEEHISVRQLWKDPIPAYIYLDKLEQKYSCRKTGFVLNPMVGEYDDPYSQRQAPLTLPLTSEGNAIIYGATGSGKTTFLTTLMYSLIKNHSAEEINLYALDFGAETLLSFVDAPQVGGVMLGHEEERIANFFKMILREFDSRRTLFSRYGGDLLSYNKNSGKTAPNILIIVNNFAAFSEQYEKFDESFAMLSRDGLKYGIQFVITASSTMTVRYRIQQNFKKILTMQLNDETGYSIILGKTGGIIPSPFKGRGLISLDRVYEFQTAYPTAEEDILGFLRAYTTELRKSGGGIAKPVPMMPEHVTLETVKDSISGLNAVPVGIEKLSLDVAAVNLKQKYIFPILTREMWQLQKFAQGLIEAVVSAKINVTVLDVETLFIGSTQPSYTYIADGFEDSGRDVFNLVVDRHNAYKKARKSGASAPASEHEFIVVIGINKLFESLSQDGADKLRNLLEKGESVFGLNIAVFDTAQNFRSRSGESWYRKHITGTDGIWVGDGLGTQLALTVSRVPIEEVGDDYGYIIQKGRTTLVKLLLSADTDESEGANNE